MYKKDNTIPSTRYFQKNKKDNKNKNNDNKWNVNGQGNRLGSGGRVFSRVKQEMLEYGDMLDKKFNFIPYTEPDIEKKGWLLNMCPVSKGDTNGYEKSGIDLYFLEQDNSSFKITIFYQPYFYLGVHQTTGIKSHNKKNLVDVVSYCQRKFESRLASANIVAMNDLDQLNHLSDTNLKKKYIKLSFRCVQDLVDVRNELLPIVRRNHEKKMTYEAYSNKSLQYQEDEDGSTGLDEETTRSTSEIMELITDIREYDVIYYMRAAIDLNLRVGSWYTIINKLGSPIITRDINNLDKAEPRVLAFDIECTKAPLKFPDPQSDSIYMISYFIDGQGYLIVNREYVSKDIEDFEYTPKEEYEGPFSIFNEMNEFHLIKRFFQHIIELKPHIFVTYNGDFFDWPFIETRAKHHNINMEDEIGIYNNTNRSVDNRLSPSNEYGGRAAVHIDAFHWVKRDSYLPQGSQGLKLVTKYKLGYDPVEVDPEDMMSLAMNDPDKMASYSVSDAVATYYLYQKYVHLFIFSLCTIIPMKSEDVLRKGSGTLCELLLMAEAFNKNIICPNKSTTSNNFYTNEKYHKNQYLIENETYVGGHVECLESGVFRSDFDYSFHMDQTYLMKLIESIDDSLFFALSTELNINMDKYNLDNISSYVLNYDEIKCDIKKKLLFLYESSNKNNNGIIYQKPCIYHLDVAAMYPNIILTNRLQPYAIVTEKTCSACDFNTQCGTIATQHRAKDSSSQESQKGISCQRDMEWVWRGEYFPAKKYEYENVKAQLSIEKDFERLSLEEKKKLTKSRLKQYCSSVYKKVKVTKEEKRNATVCMRENDFYVNCVKAFRDRRYEYKLLTKNYNKQIKELSKNTNFDDDSANDDRELAKEELKNKALVYDSLQLAHKCILNSFYGYVMRKGARWHSMEMAGVVTNTGSDIITRAHRLIEKIGRPIELDTDGIWCIIPSSFPQSYIFKIKRNDQIIDQDFQFKSMSYPCTLLNKDVHKNFTNHQYHNLRFTETCKTGSSVGSYEVRSECSIFFELDGPYKCMVLPASTEENRLLKKRYAVFNFDNTLAELKGFEIKRRGELQLIKSFQSQIFSCFLLGNSLKECYDSVAHCANQWLDVIDSKGGNFMDPKELLDLISEKKQMSGKLQDYGEQKSTSITTAKRLAEFLGPNITKDKGLACKMIISNRPYGEKVTERAIPTAIFSIKDKKQQQYYLNKWLKNSSTNNCNNIYKNDYQSDSISQLNIIRDIIDWEYYKERLGKTILKIICIPAAFQGITNPVTRIPLPDWMKRKIQEKSSKFQQTNIRDQFLNAKPVTQKKISNVQKNSKQVDLENLNSDIEIADINAQDDTADKNNVSQAASPSTKGYNMFDDENDKENNINNGNLKNTVELSISGFDKWFVDRQEKWRKKISDKEDTNKKRLNKLSSSTQSKKSKNDYAIGNSDKQGFGGFQKTFTNFLLLDKMDKLLRSHWQIIEYQALNKENGIYQAWVLININNHETPILEKIQITIPKKLYINYIFDYDNKTNVTNNLQEIGKKVFRFLPHGQKIFELYEVNITNNGDHCNDLISSCLLQDKNIKGIYESNVSPLFRAISTIGCVAKIRKDYDTSNNSNSFNFSDIEQKTTAEYDYLVDQNGENCLEKIFLYFVQHSKNLAVAGIFFPVSKNKNEEEKKKDIDDPSEIDEGSKNGWSDRTDVARAHLWIVDPFSKVKIDASNSSFPSINFSNIIGNGNNVKVESKKVVQSSHLVITEVNKILHNYHKKKSKPAIILAQTYLNHISEYPTDNIRDIIKGLHNFPIINIPVTNNDTTFPALTWKKYNTQQMINSYFTYNSANNDDSSTSNYWRDIVNCARYAHIPICNLTDKHSNVMPDHWILILDFLFARLLNSQKYILWNSNTSLPDLGGVEKDDVDYLLSLTENDDFGISGCNSNSIINIEGYYRGVCVELALEGLAVNTVYNSPQIHSLETINFDKNIEDRISDDPVSSYKYLRTLVINLCKDFATSSNNISDNLLQHFYRWLSSSKSALYDPTLHRYVLVLMKKFFLQLVNEFKKLGMTVVYADFQKMIFHTRKDTLDGAKMHCKYVINTVLSNEMFQILNFTPLKYFSNVFFMDIENYGGVLFEDSAGKLKDTTDNLKDSELISNWNISHYLPPGVNNFFILLIGQFIKKRQNFCNRYIMKRLEETKHNKNSSGLINISQDETFLNEYLLYSKHLINNYLNNKLSEIIPEIIDCKLRPSDFPNLPGSKISTDNIVRNQTSLSLSNAALEFLKYLCHILSLDKKIRDDVYFVKRSFLRLLNISEFEIQAKFSNPSLSFVLQDIICLHCNNCKNLDLCRDQQLIRMYLVDESDTNNVDEFDDNYDNDPTNHHKTWACDTCGEPYDKTLIEMKLIEVVNAKMIEYELQDYYCTKCKLPSEYKLKEYCLYCTEPLTYATSNFNDENDEMNGISILDKKKIITMLHVLKKISIFHEMKFLLEVINRLLK